MKIPELEICDASDMPDSKSYEYGPRNSRLFPGRSKMFLAAFAAYMGSIAMGAVLGYSSPALHDMEKDPNHPNDSQGAWIGSIMTVGALFGGVLAGPAIDRYGRKTVLILSVVPFTVGWFFIAFSNKNLPMLLIGRTLTGACCGIISLTVPVYLAEIATPERRGLLGSAFQMNVVIGILIIYGIGATDISWKTLALISGIFPVLLSSMMLFMPESPRWLISKKRKLEAAEAIHFLCGNNVDPEESCQELQENFDQQPKGKVSYQELLRPHIIKPVILSLSLMLFQQWCGINGVMFYAASIFKNSGYTSIDPAVSSIILGAAQVAGTLAGTLVMDKAGRKILLLVSGGFMVFGLTALSVLYGISNSKDDSKEFLTHYGWVSVASLSIYVFAFAIGYGPIPWLMMSEILPVRVKGLASSLATGFNWGNAFIITNQFQNMMDGMNTYGLYIFLDIMCVLGMIFVFIFLPETKGKSLEDIEELFIDHSDSKEEDSCVN